jgi:LmbE family N-acetylglucosaminyl deacetylase
LSSDMRWLLAVLAHPDDESMAAGGLIVRHTRSDVMVHLVCATRGEQGWGGKPPGARREDLAKIRTAEMEAAATALALAGVEIWDYPDGGVDKCDSTEITQRIWQAITTVQPAAVVTWGPDGGYGHPDHIAVGACTDAAVAAMPEGHRPALYHLAVDEQLAGFYREAARLTSVDGEALPAVIADHVDVVLELSADEVQMKLRAVDCHQSQLADWMVEIREHGDLLQKGWGHEPYAAVPSRSAPLTAAGLLGEFG